MKDYKELIVWQKAHSMVSAAYRATAKFPREELYGLTSQIRRCSASVPANIAEGCGRRGNAELHRFLQIASGSASELDYHLLLARDLGFFDEENYRQLLKQLSEVKRILTSLARKVDNDRLTAKC